MKTSVIFQELEYCPLVATCEASVLQHINVNGYYYTIIVISLFNIDCYLSELA